MALKLTPEHLTLRCTLEHFDFENTSSLPSEHTIYGQPRGVRAIDFGLGINSQGYNIYVLGPIDSSRVARVREYIQEYAKTRRAPDDWCYVNNFNLQHRPNVIRLPAGMGRTLQSDMTDFVERLKVEIPSALDGETFQKSYNQVSQQFDEKRVQIIGRVEQMASRMSFILQSTEQGTMVIVPTKPDGQALAPEEISALPEEVRAKMNEARRRLEDEIDTASRQIVTIRKQAGDWLDNLRKQIVQQVINTYLNALLEKFTAWEGVTQYLNDVRQDILENLDLFLPPADPAQAQAQAPNVFRRYEVNAFVEHDPNSGAPVEFLDLPSYRNLVGRIEHESQFGMLSTDFTLLKNGALHRANGGYLIIRAPDILAQPFAWAALKRALSTEQVAIEDSLMTGTNVMVTQTLEPSPIPLEITVILIGQQHLYYVLYEAEDDFHDLFRVKADFGDTMQRDAIGEEQYARFIANRCHDDGLKHFRKDAVGRLVEYGSWLVSDQSKLTAHFGQIASLMRESVYFADRHGHEFVTAEDVNEAIRERDYRNNELEELAQEKIQDGSVLLDVQGEVVGQVNGLVVMSLGDHSFGLPARLTARVYLGRDGIVHIDRDSEMTGNIHDKGVKILEGYLGGKYAQDYPLLFSATITFEQNYGDIEGDSASSTELFVLLSAFSGIPLRQDLAVTGSVDQRGRIQVIGGISQKIEGFFKSCQALGGLTGTQGVIMPKGNLRDLMLSEDVVEAVRAGKFHIYAISTVDEGIELMTGKPAEVVHAAVDERLLELARKMEDFGNGKSEEEEE